MYYKFSKFAKTIIIINVVITIMIGIMHGYNAHRINETNEMINNFMEEEQVLRVTAIRLLENEGAKLFLNQELTTYFGIFVTFLTLLLLYKFAKHNGFFFGFFAAFSSMFTSLIGGLLLFYLLFSGKSETDGKKGGYSFKDEWEEFIHKKSDDN